MSSRRAPLASALGVFAVLLATTDERSLGLIPDGQQMMSAAAAIARFGEIGISREFPKGTSRPAGDAVSRYGMAQSLVEALPARVAELLRRAAPGISSAPLFVLPQILLLALAAGAMADAGLGLGLSGGAAALVGAASILATPLWGYAGSDFSEPLQAASVSILLAGALRLRAGEEGRACEAATGTAAGVALLTKSLLVVVVAPLLLLALFGRERPGLRWRVAFAFGLVASVWAFFELYRFGRLFGGYEGYGFDYPASLGLLRLTLLPNKGLLVYAPLVLLAPLGFAALFGRDRAAPLALAAGPAVLLLASSAWWAWDGEAGWGPRLLLPALPCLLALVAGALRTGGTRIRTAAIALGLGGIGVNLLGALVPFSFVYAIASAAEPGPIPEERARGTRFEITRRTDGTLLAAGPRHLALTPSWSPIRVHARLLALRLRGPLGTKALAREGLPGFEPRFFPVFPAEPAGPAVLEWAANPHVPPRAVLLAAVEPFRWPFWGRSWLEPGPVDPYRLALFDQTIRALETGRTERALLLGRELAVSPDRDPKIAALAAEAALRLGHGSEADSFLEGTDTTCHLWLLFVRAERGLSVSCVAQRDREAFGESVGRAVAKGTPVSVWARRLRGP